MKILRPNRWIIDIWKEDGVWHDKYIELISDTPKNRTAIKTTVKFLNITSNLSGFLTFKAKEIKREGMVGLVIKTTSNNLEPIGNQLASEFIFYSNLGDISLKDIFKLGIETLIMKNELKKTKIIDSTKD